jgi:PPK2 family polyphosphate:nucleotide phosphotransferase
MNSGLRQDVRMAKGKGSNKSKNSGKSKGSNKDAGKGKALLEVSKKKSSRGKAAAERPAPPAPPVPPVQESTKKGKKGKGGEPEVVLAKTDAGEGPAVVEAAPEVYDTPIDAPKVDKDLRPDDPISEVLRAGRGFLLADLDAESTPGFDGGRSNGESALAAYAPEIGEWQERLFAETKAGGKRSILLVLQGLDSSGKGGIMRHVVGACDPAGIRPTAFKAPTEEELAHDFLWRIRKALPAPGQIAVFDRSHYEDVLVVKVRKLVPATEIVKRYAIINAFERELVESGTQVVKVFLYISKDEQKARLGERLERPDKRYKYTPGDRENRAYWDDYMRAFQLMFNRSSTRNAPWYVVPANKKWYARYAVQQLLLEKLREMSPDWPVPDYDIEEEKRLLAES